jgi:hypothetical protein
MDWLLLGIYFRKTLKIPGALKVIASGQPMAWFLFSENDRIKKSAAFAL